MHRKNNNLNDIKLSDLSSTDKEKVSRLVHKLVSLGKEHEETIHLLAMEKIKYQNQINLYNENMDKNISIIEERLKSKDRIILDLESKQAMYNGFIVLYQAKLKNTSEAFRFYEITENDNKIRMQQMENDIRSLQSLIESQKSTIESFQSISELNNMDSKLQYENKKLLFEKDLQGLKDIIVERDQLILQMQNNYSTLQNEYKVIIEERDFFKKKNLDHKMQARTLAINNDIVRIENNKNNNDIIRIENNANNSNMIKVSSSTAIILNTDTKNRVNDEDVSTTTTTTNDVLITHKVPPPQLATLNNSDYEVMYNTPNDSFNLSFDSINCDNFTNIINNTTNTHLMFNHKAYETQNLAVDKVQKQVEQYSTSSSVSHFVNAIESVDSVVIESAANGKSTSDIIVVDNHENKIVDCNVSKNKKASKQLRKVIEECDDTIKHHHPVHPKKTIIVTSISNDKNEEEQFHHHHKKKTSKNKQNDLQLVTDKVHNYKQHHIPKIIKSATTVTTDCLSAKTNNKTATIILKQKNAHSTFDKVHPSTSSINAISNNIVSRTQSTSAIDASSTAAVSRTMSVSKYQCTGTHHSSVVPTMLSMEVKTTNNNPSSKSIHLNNNVKRNNESVKYNESFFCLIDEINEHIH